MTVQVVTDSVASLPADLRDDLHIEVLSLSVHDSGIVYDDVTMDVDAFYARIDSMKQAIPTSSQPSQKCMFDFFVTYAKAGIDVLGVLMSSKMSGTFEGALLAARHVKHLYPDWKCRLLDSTSNSFDEGFAVLAGAEGARHGGTLDECASIAEETCAATRWLFSPDSLVFLKAGGRIGGAKAFLADKLSIVPVLTVKNGVADACAKVRTQRKALAKIVSKFEEDVQEHGLEDVVVHYIGLPDRAQEWARKFIEPIANKKIRVLPVSPVIGCHVGPAIGIVYRCKTALTGKSAKPIRSLLVTPLANEG